MLSGAIEQAQKTVESRNFQTRKSVLEYDDVMNQQRNIIYDERRKVLDGEDLRGHINKMVYEFISGTVNDALHGGSPENQEHLNEVTAPFEKLFLPKGAIRLEASAFTISPCRYTISARQSSAPGRTVLPLCASWSGS